MVSEAMEEGIVKADYDGWMSESMHSAALEEHTRRV